MKKIVTPLILLILNLCSHEWNIAAAQDQLIILNIDTVKKEIIQTTTSEDIKKMNWSQKLTVKVNGAPDKSKTKVSAEGVEVKTADNTSFVISASVKEYVITVQYDNFKIFSTKIHKGEEEIKVSAEEVIAPPYHFLPNVSD